MIGFYDYTVVATYLSLASSCLGIYFAFTGRPLHAIFCLLVSGFLDLFDGKIARTKKDRTDNERKFGIQLDSLCDIVCFGVLPTAIGYSIGLSQYPVCVPVMTLFPLCALIRLAFFNVTEEERQETTTEVRKYYLGMPVTTVAFILPFVYGLSIWIKGNAFLWVYSCVLAIIAILFISPIKFKKPGKVGTVISVIFGVAAFALLLYQAIK